MWAFCFVGNEPQPLVRFIRGETAYLCEPESLRGRMNMNGAVFTDLHAQSLAAGPVSQYAAVVLVPQIDRHGKPL